MEIIEIKYTTKDETSKIIATRKPLGLFYERDGDLHVGIDNSTGEAWVEEFKTARECLDWLRGDREGTVEEKGEYLTELERKQLKIIDHYGADWQLDRLVEECAELIQAIMKARKLPEGFISADVIQEIADVENLIRQLKLKHKNLKTAINIIIERKVDRQLERIEKGE